MPFDYSNDALIASVKRRGSIPTAQPLFENSDFLTLADEEMFNTIFPMIMAIKGDYFVTISDTTMTSAVTYPIPSDAVGLKVKDVAWRPSSATNQLPFLIPQVNYTDIADAFATGWANPGYYIQGDNIILVPTSMEGQTLRMRYYKRASKLVPNDEGCTIESINSGTDEVTVDAVPAAWAAGDLLSGIDSQPGFNTIVTGLEIQSVAGSVITLDDVSDLSVGDLLCLDGESTIAQITPEAHPILAQAVLVKCLEALGDQKMAVAQAKLSEIIQNFIKQMTPRADGQAKKIVNRNSPLAWGNYARFGWW